MKIEIWSDFACPYCYIGEKKLEKALAEIELQSSVEIKYRSFQLNVDAVSHQGEDIHGLIAKKYGIPYETAKAANENIVNVAAAVGLNFDFEQIKPGNTRLAHEVSKYSDSMGKGNEIADRLFAAYFEEGVNLSDENSLLELAEEIGLDKARVQEVLEQNRYTDNVAEDQKTARQMGINSVPFFIINDKETVSGAQSVAYFKMVLEKVIED